MNRPLNDAPPPQDMSIPGWLQSACLQNGRNIYNETLGKVRGDVRTCLIGLPKLLLCCS